MSEKRGRLKLAATNRSDPYGAFGFRPVVKLTIFIFRLKSLHGGLSVLYTKHRGFGFMTQNKIIREGKESMYEYCCLSIYCMS